MILRSEWSETFNVLSAWATASCAANRAAAMAPRAASPNVFKRMIALSTCWRRCSVVRGAEPIRAAACPAPNVSNLELFVGQHPRNGGACQHAILERTVVRQIRDRQLTPHAPGIKHQGIGIENRIGVAQPLAPVQQSVDLL